MQRDRDSAAAPGARLRDRREPEVDRRALDRRARVGGDARAVAGDRHARAERDHARIDGDDAPAGRRAGGGVAVDRVAGGDDRQRARRPERSAIGAAGCVGETAATSRAFASTASACCW